MKRSLISSISILFAIALLAAGCGGQTGQAVSVPPEAQAQGTPVQRGDTATATPQEFDPPAMKTEPTATALVPGATNMPGTPITSHGGPVKDYVSLVDSLRAAGATVEPSGDVSQPFFSVKGLQVKVNGVDVQAFEYESAAAADGEASKVSSDGGSVGTSMVSWVEPPHFYKAGRVIVLYVGSDSSVQKALESVLGKQFAGR